MTDSLSDPALIMKPIGVIRTTMRLKFESPHQPRETETSESSVELFGNQHYDLALRDLATFDRIWLIWWFHRNKTWRPLVLPPRGKAVRRGVFATRSPHRPNPIGLTAVPLIKVERTRLIVGSNDLVDGTPILDIKPYLAHVDAFPDASLGWLSDLERTSTEPTRFIVRVETPASEQLNWLREHWEIDFLSRAKEILERDPTIHRTRRIRRYREDLFQIGCGAWKIYFSVVETVVTVREVQVGYPDRLLMAGDNEYIPDQAAQVAFRQHWR